MKHVQLYNIKVHGLELRLRTSLVAFKLFNPEI